MDKITFEFDRKEIEKKIEDDLRKQVKSYATSIGFATFNLSEYVKENEELQKIIKEEVMKKLKDSKFMNDLVKGIVEEAIVNKLKFK